MTTDLRNSFSIIKTRTVIIFVILLTVSGEIADGCTTFIISGKYTPDGRPVLFKNRDTDIMDNALVYFKDGRYDYIGLVTGDSTWNKMVWGGYNSTGFAIINSAAYNNNVGDTIKLEDQEGVLMKEALMYCRTLADFENMLDTVSKPLGVDANFGVIDAEGGAAYYETGNFRYVKYDVNDPKTAPEGFLVRTNHSMSGNYEKGLGHCRYNTAMIALTQAAAKHELTPMHLFNCISRNLTHSLTGTDLTKDIPSGNEPQYRFYIDYIPRRITSAAVMIVGAKNEKDADNAMMWTILGFPLTSVAVPVWIAGGGKLPASVSMMPNLHAPLCDAALKMKDNCFPLKPDGGQNYINITAVLNREKTGYMQILKPVEENIFAKAGELSSGLENGKRTRQDIRNFYNWLDDYINTNYEKNLKISVTGLQEGK